jgi:prepilin-type processing-associated H-X9-DG protein
MALATKKRRALGLGLVVACLAVFGCGLGAVVDGGFSGCGNNLLKIGQALHQHHDELGSFPKAAIADKDGRPGLSWRVAILPFLGEKELYAKFKLDEPWDSANNKPLLAQMPAVFACPSRPSKDPSVTNYRAFIGNGSFFEPAYDKRLEKVWWVGDDGVKHYVGEPRSGTRIADFVDGPANTLMLFEAKDGVPWTKPEDVPFEPSRTPGPLASAGSPHFGGFNVLFVDGSVWFLPETTSPELFRSLITRNGGEVVSLDRSTSKRQSGREEPKSPEADRPRNAEPVMRK